MGLVASALGTWVNPHREPGYRTVGASAASLAVLFASIVYAQCSGRQSAAVLNGTS